VELAGPIGKLSGDLLHWPYRRLSEHLDTIERYTTTMAEGLHERGRRASVSSIVTHPLVRFVRFYFLKGGFLDGWRGLLLAFLAAHYVRLKYAKLLLLQRVDTARDHPPGTDTGVG
jgi:hypothetical protein